MDSLSSVKTMLFNYGGGKGGEGREERGGEGRRGEGRGGEGSGEGRREGEGREGRGGKNTVGTACMVQSRLTFVSWLTASPPAANWRTLATAMRIMYWRREGSGGRGHEGGVRRDSTVHKLHTIMILMALPCITHTNSTGSYNHHHHTKGIETHNNTWTVFTGCSFLAALSE